MVGCPWGFSPLCDYLLKFKYKIRNYMCPVTFTFQDTRHCHMAQAIK